MSGVYKINYGDIPSVTEPLHRPHVSIEMTDSVSAAYSAHMAGELPCILNFANNYTPGGMTSCKGSTQEEQLFRNSNISNSTCHSMYPIDNIEDCYKYWKYNSHGLLYYPKVTFTQPNFTCAVISSAAIVNPKSQGDTYFYDKDRTVTQEKISLILDVAFIHNYTLIAGEWGMGAFSNPLQILDIWVSEIAIRDIHVIFAILKQYIRSTLEESIRKIDYLL